MKIKLAALFVLVFIITVGCQNQNINIDETTSKQYYVNYEGETFDNISDYVDSEFTAYSFGNISYELYHVKNEKKSKRKRVYTFEDGSKLNISWTKDSENTMAHMNIDDIISALEDTGVDVSDYYVHEMEHAEDLALVLECYNGKFVDIGVFIHNKKFYTITEIPSKDEDDDFYFSDANIYDFLDSVEY